MYRFHIEDVEIYCGSLHVAHVKDAFESEETWGGEFELVTQNLSDPSAQRIRQFIDFSMDWHARIDEPETRATEWDEYKDVVESDQWFMEGPSGNRVILQGAPVFHPEGHVAWRTAKKYRPRPR